MRFLDNRGKAKFEAVPRAAVGWKEVRAMTAREEHVEKLNRAKDELKRATGWHKRDIHKYIKRLEGELRTYNYYQSKAKAGT